MKIWAIADLHLAFGAPEKDMAFFGPTWEGYAKKIADSWKSCVEKDDLVLIAGDISWAMRPEQALVDLLWIDQLPGTKVCIKGNHDYWWSSLNRVRAIAPPSIHFLQHNAFTREGVSISGTRLWDTEEFGFGSYVEIVANPRETAATPIDRESDRKIFERELGRLELALKSLHPQAHTRIIMTHYPPISADLKPSRASALLEAYKINYCIFGHLHNLKPGIQMFGERNGVNYLLTSADYLAFQLYQVV